MSGYSTNPAMCRVDVWKLSGKWYETIAVEFKDYNEQIHEAFEDTVVRALKQPDGYMRLGGMHATCLEPYHQHAHPISMIIPGA
jgi:hypothetical protein